MAESRNLNSNPANHKLRQKFRGKNGWKIGKLHIFINPFEKKLPLTHCQIFDKNLSNGMDMPENFYKNGIILAEIDKNLDCLGHISIE